MAKVEAILAELREERERLRRELGRVERVIAVLEDPDGMSAAAGERATTVNTAAAAAETVTATATPVVGQPYTMLDLYEAAAKYLASVDTPKTSRQIADALRAGGFKTRSKKFGGTVRTMLRRSSARSAGIRATSDGKRWFTRRTE